MTKVTPEEGLARGGVHVTILGSGFGKKLQEAYVRNETSGSRK